MKQKFDILYLVYNRVEYTRESLRWLLANTNWSLVRAIWMYVDVRGPDAEDDGAQELALEFEPPAGLLKIDRPGAWGGPVNVMNAHLQSGDDTLPFVKIDNDVIVPPGWLDAAAKAWEWGAVDLLGLEPPKSRTPAPWAGGKRIEAPEDRYSAEPPTAACRSIGGVGVMDPRCLQIGKMTQHSIVGGFTDWQDRHPDVRKGWLIPPLRLFLLDRLPFNPWFDLGRKYEALGWQRPWTHYSMEECEWLCKWWLDARR